MPILRIKILTGPLKGTQQRFDRFPITLGRSPDNSLPISGDDRISRAHVRIRHVPPNLMVEDLQSRNGTFIEETRITDPVPISSGKVIRFGHTLVQFEVEGMGIEVAGTPAAVGTTPKSLVEAVLVLDLCDSTTMANRYGDAFALQIKEALRGLVKPIFTQAGVSFLKGTGDGFLATFPDLTKAVESAVRILQEKGDVLPKASDGRSPMLRFGIHFGQTHVDSDGDRQGDVINMAFRLEGAGTSGFHETRGGLEKDSLPLQDRVFVSEHAHAELDRLGGLPSRLVGFFDLKGLAGRHRVYEVLWREIPVPGETVEDADKTMIRPPE
jgi:pSer/pThr/pTyr-binding forkhead associated (FHA) protein